VHPMRDGDPLRGKGLELVDSVERCVVQEAADELEAFVVGDVGGRLEAQGAAVEVVLDVCFDDRRCHGSTDGESVDGHVPTSETIRGSGPRGDLKRAQKCRI
jgi:hypothetical protein